MADRAWVAAQVATRLSVPMAMVQMQPEDDTGQLKEPLDDTMRGLGFAETQIASPQLLDTDLPGVLALAQYNVLLAIRTRLLGNFDLTTSRGTNLRLNQQLQNVERMIKDASAAVVQWFGEIPSGGDGGAMMLNLSYQSDAQGYPVSHDWPYTVIGVGDG